MRRRLSLSCALLAALLLAATPVMAALSWIEGTPSRPLSSPALSGTVRTTVDGKPAVTLARRANWEYRSPAGAGALRAESLGEGRVLVADPGAGAVTELSADGNAAWSYSGEGLREPVWAQRLPGGNTLIVDKAAHAVIEVTAEKRVAWRYSTQGEPVAAQRLPNGNTLVVDGSQLTEVASDGELVRSLSTAGLGADALVPTSAYRLPNGSLLVAGTGDGRGRVVEIDSSGVVVWRASGAAALGPVADAVRLRDGSTLVAESSGRLIELDAQGEPVADHKAGTPLSSGGVLGGLGSVRWTEGGLLLADPSSGRVVVVGYADKGTVTSGSLALSSPARKRFHSITVNARMAGGTSVATHYSIDGGPWRAAGSGGKLPSGSLGKKIRYRLTLTTSDPAHTPVVLGVTILYDLEPPSAKAPSSGAAGGGGTGSGSGTHGWGGGAGGGSGGYSWGGTGSLGEGGTGGGASGGMPLGDVWGGTGFGSEAGTGSAGMPSISTPLTSEDASAFAPFTMPFGDDAFGGDMGPTYAQGTLLEAVWLEGSTRAGGGTSDIPARQAALLGLSLLGSSYLLGAAGSPSAYAAMRAGRWAYGLIGRRMT